MNWYTQTDYDYTLALNGQQWVWEFLRCNNNYHQDDGWFLTTGETLKQCYGKSPERKFTSIPIGISYEKNQKQ